MNTMMDPEVPTVRNNDLVHSLKNTVDCRLPRPVRNSLVRIALLLFLLDGTVLAEAQTFTVLHSFSGTDGTSPAYGSLIRDATGNLYGTTYQGGVPDGCFGYGCGVAFKLDPAGNETVLHTFTNSSGDGWQPMGTLLKDSLGNLYGATVLGGANCGIAGCGTVYKLDVAGNETILYSFDFSVFGGGETNPENIIRDSVGNFYGVAVNGGATYPNYHGAVFKLDTSFNETVFHNFSGPDGSTPYGALIMDSSGNFYGTAGAGGNLNGCSGNGCGVVFKLDPSGNETVLHSFSGNDGEFPNGGLVMDSAGNLYGTTVDGGSSGVGTVYKIDPSGNFSVLHNFSGQSDGGYPFGALVNDFQGNFYGTTQLGGSTNDCSGYGCGVVFKIDASGNESVVHTFAQSEGAYSLSTPLLDSARNLYGTTSGGGAFGDGSVFKISLAAPFSTFSDKLAITAGPPPGFSFKADMTQAAGAPVIDPVTQSLALSVGPYSVVIPAGSFAPKKNGAYVYSGTSGGVALQIRILQTGSASYQVQVTATGVDLTTVTAPIPVALSLGYNSGSAN